MQVTVSPDGPVPRQTAAPVRARWTHHAWEAGCAAAVLAWFLYHAGAGLFVPFHMDDMMNLYWAWTMPLRDMALGAVFPFTAVYRPATEAVYRGLFALVGLEPLAFRYVHYTLLLLNVYLVYRLAVRLSCSREVGFLAALLNSFHTRFIDLYINNGTLFDVLCGTLLLTLLEYYIALRRRGEWIRGWRWALLYLWFALALSAKEMAAALPLLILTYEAIYHPPQWLRAGSVARWMGRQGRPALFCGALVPLVMRAKSLPPSVLAGNPMYAMKLSLPFFLENQGRMLGELLLYPLGAAISPGAVMSIWLVVFAIAAGQRRRDLFFYGLMALIASLPVSFVVYRGFFCMYLPYLGWSLYCATLLVMSRDAAWRKWMRGRQPAGVLFGASRLLLAGLLAAAICWFQQTDVFYHQVRGSKASVAIGQMLSEFSRLQPTLPTGARVLLQEDRFPADTWTPVFVMRLYYRDASLHVDRAKTMPSPPTLKELDRYPYVFTYENGKLLRLKPAT